MNISLIDSETTDALIEAMRSQDFVVTKAELARWHRAGLIPLPVRRSLGRGRGMVSIYPSGTTKQLLALCMIHRTEKRLPMVAWHMWWAGYDIPFHYVQRFLDHATDSWQQGFMQLRQWAEQPETLSRQLDRFATARLSRKALAQARKRVGWENFPTFVEILIRIMMGTFTGWTNDEERRIFETGMGLLRARTGHMAEAGPWLTGDIGEPLAMLSGHLHAKTLTNIRAETQSADLMIARDEVRRFTGLFVGFSAIVDELIGRDALGFSAFAGAIQDLTAPTDQATLLLFWLLLRAWGLGTAMDMLLRLADQWEQVWGPLLQALLQLREAIPATAEALAPTQLRPAFRRKMRMVYLNDWLARIAQEHQAEIAAYFDSFPGIKQLLAAAESILNTPNEK
ncbi:MAG: hypothetical protein H0U76_02010 [Ktedonobacteraceae bacterium]|nr:hypothetical protein [Ktedonobacteraceae bacterium]